MKAFLEYVAEDIFSKYGTNLAKVAVVFPNKRASLFLSEYLALQARRPIWSPAYLTISDLFRMHSNRVVADPVKLVCDLHHSFLSQTGIDESLDHFYGWGQLLLSDFDDIDKNMADADRVFNNLKDIHELDDIGYLSEEQKEAIRRFFSNFSDDHNSQLKERFLRLWSHMGDIYHDFNQRLASQSLAYEGALYREVASSADIDFRYDTYLFVGFNMLQRVERQLFLHLKKQGKARFYWDFDHYYMHNNEAGHFIGQYLEEFPNELDCSNADIYHSFQRPKTISILSAPTENIQARYVSHWLKEDHLRSQDGRQTAIVLCNELLLPTVIHCLPDTVSKVNITTGYPLAQTPVATLITQLTNLRTIGYDAQHHNYRTRYVNAVKRHPYITALQIDINDLLFRPFDSLFPTNELVAWLCEVIQTVAQEKHDTDPLFQESVFRAYTLVNRLKALTESGDLQVDTNTLQRLISQMMQSVSIPFHGEPAEGLQVMGVLETRNLDFSHVLLLSCNEGNIPRGINDTSFIPYTIRKAYGLTTIDHKAAIYSYYFHRLLQRASDITIVYNNSTIDGQRGEMSRFVLQLMAEGTHDIEFKTLQAGQDHTPFQPPVIAKTPQIIQALRNRYSSEKLSPTAINRYMRCPLLFYYNYVCNLREPDMLEEQTIDNRIFGNIFHEASRIIYARLTEKSRRIVASDIEHLLKTKPDIERAVDEAFMTEFFKIQQQQGVSRPEYNGLQLISREVIIHYLRQLLEIDRRLAPFTILKLEEDVVKPLEIKSDDTTFTTTIGGRVDRMDLITDEAGERIRVVDYKTSSYRIRPLADVNAVFEHENLRHHSDYYLQTIIYADIVSQQQQAENHPLPVSPALIFIQHAASENYDPTLCFGNTPIRDVAEIAQPFNEKLQATVNEIFSTHIDFIPTSDREQCGSCSFHDLCRLHRSK